MKFSRDWHIGLAIVTAAIASGALLYLLAAALAKILPL